MVKIPSLDELKKMGSGIIDHAKSVKFGEMVDKVKSGIDSIQSKAASNIKNENENLEEDSNIKTIFKGIYANLAEVTAAQAQQVKALKKLETQLEVLAKIIETSQPNTASKADASKKGAKKDE